MRGTEPEVRPVWSWRPSPPCLLVSLSDHIVTPVGRVVGGGGFDPSRSGIRFVLSTPSTLSTSRISLDPRAPDTLQGYENTRRKVVFTQATRRQNYDVTKADVRNEGEIHTGDVASKF